MANLNLRTFPGYGELDAAGIAALSMDELVKLRNELKPDQPVMQFKNKIKANSAVWVLGTPVADPSDETHNSSGETNMSKVERTKAEIRADKAAAKAEKEAAKALEPKVEKAPKAPRAPAEWSDLPEGEHQQEPRPDSVASKTLLLIDANQGATLDEIQAEIGEKHSARRLLTWMNKERGYGFTMTDGKILYQANNVTIPVPAPKAKPVAE